MANQDFMGNIFTLAKLLGGLGGNAPAADATGGVSTDLTGITPYGADQLTQAPMLTDTNPSALLGTAATAAPSVSAAVMPNATQAAQSAAQIGDVQTAAAQANQPLASSGALGGGLSATEVPQQTAQAAPTEKGAWETFLENISGGPQDPEGQKEWRRNQTIGVIGNALASALAGDSPVGRGAGALRNVFAGQLSAKNAETRQQEQNDLLTSLSSSLNPGAVAPMQTSSVPGQASGSTASLGSTPSALASTDFAKSPGSGFGSVDDYYLELEKRLQTLGG